MDSVRDQEGELRDLLRRANGAPDRSGVLRRNALNKLVDTTHSPHPSLKILAAKHIPDVFSDFPDQEEAAINAVYDLCEDQSSTVRKAGYAAITALSSAANKWVKRNTDVLLQLLQSDEPDEVDVVKQALLAHLDLDARVTLSVLCDQIMPAAEGTTDPDELFMRDRLRTLVLAFLTGEAKRPIVDRHALPNSEAEAVLIDTFLAAIPKLSPADTDIIVKQLLLDLQSYRPGLPRSNALLRTLLDQAQVCFKAEAKQRALVRTRFYMDLMAYVTTEKSLGSPLDLLRFYLPALVAKMTLLLLSPDDQVYVICNMAETFAACEKARDNSQQLAVLRNQSVDASPNLFECLAKADLADKRSRNACKVLLGCCLRRKLGGWTVPSHLRTSLEFLRSKTEQDKDVQELIRSLLAQDKVAQNGLGSDKGQVPVTSRRFVIQRPPPGRYTEGLVASTSGLGSKEHSTNKHSVSAGSESSPRPPKRLRTESDTSPSLLSRMTTSGSTGTEDRPRARVRSEQETTASAGVAIPRGYSIKGAAKAVSTPPPLPPTPPSLLDRIVMDDGGPGGGGGRARYKW